MEETTGMEQVNMCAPDGTTTEEHHTAVLRLAGVAAAVEEQTTSLSRRSTPLISFCEEKWRGEVVLARRLPIR